MYNTMEMELIAQLYGYMDENDKINWSVEDAEDIFEDELKISAERGYEFPFESVEVLYETIKEMIRQDLEDNNS